MTPPKLIIFDADGTLRRCMVPGQPCPNRDGEWELFPDVKAKIEPLIGRVTFGVATNQGGIAAGFLSYDDAVTLLWKMMEEIEPLTTRVDHPWLLAVCAHAPNVGCDCRKPAPGLLHTICRGAGIDPKDALFVGDQTSDCLAAVNAGMPFQNASEFFGETVVSIWSVCERPLDRPDLFVARRIVTPLERRLASGPCATQDEFTGHSLEEVREKLPAGLHRIPRHPADEPQMMEAWV